jgi:hypothetical protein
MSLRSSPHLFFLIAGIGLYLIASVGFEILARVVVGGESLSYAISETIQSIATQPIANLMLLAPFIALAWLGGALARVSRYRAIMLFILGSLILSAVYYHGHMNAQTYTHEHKWTAASLSVGLIPLKSIPVLLVLLIAKVFLERRGCKRNNRGQTTVSRTQSGPEN